jgi:glucuronate isomerase
MFTSEPSLVQRIERMIGDTPVVDPFSQIHCDQPGVSDLAAFLRNDLVSKELISVGMSLKDLYTPIPPDEFVRRAIPYLKKMRNTATAWCLFRIFRDLYDFDEPNLTEANSQGLFDKVLASTEDPGWAGTVLRDRSKITTVVTKLGNKSTDPSKNPDSFYYRLDALELIRPDFSSAVALTTNNDYFASLEELLGERPTTTERLERLIFDWLDRTITGRVRFTSLVLPIEHRFSPPDEAHAQFVLSQASDDREISEKEANWLAGFVSWSILKWHHDNKKAVQLAIRADDWGESKKNLPRSEGTWSSEMARTFDQFDNAKFDLLMALNSLDTEAALLASQFPNVFVSTDWGWASVPMLIEQNIGLRVQIAPMTKISGFASDASTVEWTYGKLQIVRKAMAEIFARLVDARFFEEDEIPPLLRQIFHDTPRDLYGLGVD